MLKTKSSFGSERPFNAMDDSWTQVENDIGRAKLRRHIVRTAPDAPPAILSDVSAWVRQQAKLYAVGMRTYAARMNDAKWINQREAHEEYLAMTERADAGRMQAEKAVAQLIARCR